MTDFNFYSVGGVGSQSEAWKNGSDVTSNKLCFHRLHDNATGVSKNLFVEV